MKELIKRIKQQFGIIGYDYTLLRALEKTMQISPTDISVLVLGESGVGKEFIPKIIHKLSFRKHHNYISVNCGAIPEGTIDSELFGHEKGSFTGAINMRKGYFEVANGGTIFLDEVGELPLSTQVRLLRVLETGEFIKVGSSKIQKTNIRIVAATSLDIIKSINEGKFREDLYYRLNTVQINIPPLRLRKNDIKFLLKKFSNDFSEKYKMPPISLTENSLKYLEDYPWPGNIRQLKNLIEQISVVETNREINIEKLKEYVPNNTQLLSMDNKTLDDNYKFGKESILHNLSRERDLIYKIFFDMKKNLNDLKSIIYQLIKSSTNIRFNKETKELINKVFGKIITHTTNPENINNNCVKKENSIFKLENNYYLNNKNRTEKHNGLEECNYIEESSFKTSFSSLQKREIKFIKQILEKNNGKRKKTAKDLGISERTLYRKIKQYNL